MMDNKQEFCDKIVSHFGLIDEFINSVDDVEGIISAIPKHPIVPFFRGEINAEWDITPGIGRKDKYPKDFNFDNFNFQKFEKEIFEDFYKSTNEPLLKNLIQYEFEKGTNKYNWKLLVQYQHLMGVTSLIDFTNDIKTALYFATQYDKNFEDKDGQIWILHYNDTKYFQNSWNLLTDIDTFDNDVNIHIMADIYIDEEIKPSTYNQSYQRGQLFKQKNSKIEKPLNYNEEIKEYLYRLIIPASAKLKIREELKNFGESIYSKETMNICTQKLVIDAFHNALEKYL